MAQRVTVSVAFDVDEQELVFFTPGEGGVDAVLLRLAVDVVPELRQVDVGPEVVHEVAERTPEEVAAIEDEIRAAAAEEAEAEAEAARVRADEERDERERERAALEQEEHDREVAAEAEAERARLDEPGVEG